MTKPKKVSEAVPIQVYLVSTERSRLARLAAQLDTTMSDVLRKGVAALERELLDPVHHPALAIIGLAGSELVSDGRDAARDHDDILAETEEASWLPAPPTVTYPTKRRSKRRGT